MSKRPPPPEGFDPNPEWTDADWARARPAREVLPELLGVAAEPLLARRPRGRPRSESSKTKVNIRLSPDVLAHWRATGPGWQSRIDDLLRAAMSQKEGH
jgi:uncharacterized protein (DUF4415 family)